MSIIHAYRQPKEGDSRFPGWTLKWSLEPDKLEEFKRRVPWSHRSWSQPKGEWWVSADYEDVVLDLWPDFRAYLDQPQLF